jgi:hypothetical protein
MENDRVVELEILLKHREEQLSRAHEAFSAVIRELAAARAEILGMQEAER